MTDTTDRETLAYSVMPTKQGGGGDVVSQSPTEQGEGSEVVSQGITLSEAAQAHIKRELTKRDAAIGMRFGVEKNGCSGMGYVVDYLEEADPSDRVFQIDSQFSVYVNETSWPYVKGTHIDFKREGINEQFAFDNPNAQNACGCGESFNIE